jgi:phage tail sheath gpL-like
MQEAKRKDAEHHTEMGAAQAELKAKESERKRECAILVSQRDGALSQVQALREQVTELSRSLALAKDSHCSSAVCSSTHALVRMTNDYSSFCVIHP